MIQPQYPNGRVAVPMQILRELQNNSSRRSEKKDLYLRP
jgi:hypothetical protein